MSAPWFPFSFCSILLPSLPSRCCSQERSPGNFLSASLHLSICCQGGWPKTLCHLLAGDLWTRHLISLLLNLLIRKTKIIQCLPCGVLWERNKLIYPNLLEQCLARSKYSINVYYELLLWACFLIFSYYYEHVGKTFIKERIHFYINFIFFQLSLSYKSAEQWS